MSNIDWSKMRTAEQIEAERIEKTASAARQERDRRLAATDYLMMPDYPNKPSNIEQYRQALRDITQQSGFPDAIDWPELN